MGVHTFPKGICPKVKVLARLEYELAYYDSAVHRFNHYTKRTPLVYFSYICTLRYLSKGIFTNQKIVIFSTIKIYLCEYKLYKVALVALTIFGRK